MTREHKLALIIGFALVLTVGMLVSDHFSTARASRLAPIDERPPVAGGVSASLQPTPGLESRDGSAAAPLLDRPLPDPSQAALAARDPSPPASTPGQASGDGATLASLAAGSDLESTGQEPFVPAAQAEEISAFDRAPSPAPTRRRRIQAGDTLWSICAAEYGDGSLHPRLAAYNADRLGKDGGLRVGATILLPPVEMLTGARGPQAEDARNAAAPHRQPDDARAYVVQRGDTLSEIAQRTLGSAKRMDEIVRLNRDAIDDADDIRVGMRLRLPSG